MSSSEFTFSNNMWERIGLMASQLCSWYESQLSRIDEAETVDQCELLLCAHDLGFSEAKLVATIHKLAQHIERSDMSSYALLPEIMRQLVFTRYALESGRRRQFAEIWVNDKNARSQGLFFESILVNFALQNQQFLTAESLEWAIKWYHKHRPFKSDKVAAWAPHCLKHAGSVDAAKHAADEILARREADGSWGHEFNRTIVCAYALALTELLPAKVFEQTVHYIERRFRQGMVSSLPARAQTLKLLHILGLVPVTCIQTMRDRLIGNHKIFVSYSRRDLTITSELKSALETAGFDVWIDLHGIAAGEEWPQRLADAIIDCHLFLMVISESAISSDYFLKEILFAVKRKKAIYAAFLDATPIPAKIDLMLGNVQQVNRTDHPNFESFLKAVVSGIRRQIRASN